MENLAVRSTLTLICNCLTEQMEAYNIEKTILCPAGCHLNEELKTAYQAAPDKIIPLCWVNANEGQEAYDMLEHYLRDEEFCRCEDAAVI